MRFRMVLAVMLLGCAVSFADRSYTITLDGKEPDYYYIVPLRDVGWEDDRFILDLYPWTLLLEGEDEYHFTTHSNAVGRLFLEVDGKEKLIGISYKAKEGKKFPYSDLLPEEIHKLRAIDLDGELGDCILALLNQIDPNKAFVSLNEPFFGRKNPGQFPAISLEIKFLRTNVSSSPSFIGYEHLHKMHALEYLRMHTGVNQIDYGWLKNCANLKYLDLGMVPLRDLENLEKLRDLRYLNLSRCYEVDNIEFVRSLPELRHLKICNTRIQDLTPLNNLKHIETVDAGRATVTKLPTVPIENLVYLRVMGADVGAEQVRAFQQENPHCNVVYDWNISLQDALKDVDRFRVRSGGTYIEYDEEVETLFETSDPKEIRQVSSLIQINPEASGSSCKCSGRPTMEFYRDRTLAVTLSIHHAQSLRWSGGEWTGDGGLTENSQEFLITWLDEHGVSRPREEAEESRIRVEKSRIARKKWMKGMPNSIKPLWEDHLPQMHKDVDTEPLSLALVNEMPNQSQRILALLTWYGSGEGSWSMHYGYESMPEPMLLEYDTADIVAAVESTELSYAQLEGAGRLFSGNTFRRERPKGLNKVPRYMKQMLWDHVKSTGSEDNMKWAKSAFMK